MKGGVGVQINRLAGLYDWDGIINQKAIARGYDTFQVSVQPNSLGGWCAPP